MTAQHGKIAPAPMSSLRTAALLLFCVTGIYTAYLTQVRTSCSNTPSAMHDLTMRRASSASTFR